MSTLGDKRRQVTTSDRPRKTSRTSAPAGLPEPFESGSSIENPIIFPSSPPPSPPPKPSQSSQNSGRQTWHSDCVACQLDFELDPEITGYVGMVAKVKSFTRSNRSLEVVLEYEDIDGRAHTVTLCLEFKDLPSYPKSYTVAIAAPGTPPRRLKTTSSRFKSITHLGIQSLLERIVSSLQGDDEADGRGTQQQEDDEESLGDLDHGEEFMFGQDVVTQSGSTGGGQGDIGGRAELKEHFLQIKAAGWRPGLTRVSDFWSPWKNMGIDPNTLAMWDDGLVEAWKNDKRFTLLIGTETYPPRLDNKQYWIGLFDNYKPTIEQIKDCIKGREESAFYTSSSLTGYLKSFAKAFKLRTAFALDWGTADSVAMDEEASRLAFQDSKIPNNKMKEEDSEDPAGKGYEGNLPLCAFYWILRRFKEAPKYCLCCGMVVQIPSLRPYTCDKPLCVYTYMSLGLGPSVEHTIRTNPAVVDILLTMAHASALTATRMDLPLQLNIEVPREFGLPDPQLIDTLPSEQIKPALVWLIEALPPVSIIKDFLDEGRKLSSIACPPGSIGVLRWAVGSCRAYLKEVKPDEGIQGVKADVKQFTFVVGSPQQESNFSAEMQMAPSVNPSAARFPTMLAYHGSGIDKWHNILRTGLDFQETINGRVINVPNTFVSTNPYLVVNDVKQIKPFLPLVHGTKGDATGEGELGAEDLFQHDPSLQVAPTYNQQPLRVKLPKKVEPQRFIDLAEDDVTDQKLLKKAFEPSPADRFARLRLMPPPTETSITASKTLQREFKTIIQTVDDLPFYVNPEADSLYCWTIKLWDFPDSELKNDMQKFGIRSIIAELRFPASFPNNPPFMRILHPRLLPIAARGGGNITAGGSVCNELLTTTGWNILCNVEGIVRDVMFNMTEATPPARIDPKNWDIPYGMQEALEAYKRGARQHGWEIPKDFDKIAQ